MTKEDPRPDQWKLLGTGDPSADLVPSLSLDGVLSRHAALVGAVRKTRNAYLEQQSATAALLGEDARGSSDFALEWTRTRRDLDGEEELTTAIRRIDAACWSLVLDRSGLRQLMDQELRSEWNESLEKLEMPDFTRENVEATFASLSEQRAGIFERGVVNVFRKLSWSYKTNSPVKLGKRMIVRYAAERFQYRDRGGRLVTNLYGPSHEFAAKLDDLVRAFCVLEGKPELGHDRGAYAMLSRGNWMDERGDKTPSKDAELHGYLRFRGFKNGNAHVTFLRLDLIDQLNRIIAKAFPNALPPAEEVTEST